MFITFEGPDGSGKTTQSKLLEEYFRIQNKAVVWTREPGDSNLGKKIRELLLEDRNIHLNDITELLLFSADRSQHISEVIKPALAAGKIVICDRFIDSTLAYQIGGKGLDEKMVKNIINYSTTGLLPDLTILIDIPTDIGLQRATKERTDKYEAAAITFHQRVRKKYLEIAKKEKRFKIFDGTKPIPDVFEEIKKLF